MVEQLEVLYQYVTSYLARTNQIFNNVSDTPVTEVCNFVSKAIELFTYRQSN